MSNDDMDERLTIGEIAALAGLQTSTLRYYEKIGLLPKPRRVSGQRRYSREILVLLSVIQVAKEANFTLDEIRDFLYGDDGTPSERWRQRVEYKLFEVKAMIEQAQMMQQLLEEALESDALHYEMDSCTLLARNPLT